MLLWFFPSSRTTSLTPKSELNHKQFTIYRLDGIRRSNRIGSAFNLKPWETQRFCSIIELIFKRGFINSCLLMLNYTLPAAWIWKAFSIIDWIDGLMLHITVSKFRETVILLQLIALIWDRNEDTELMSRIYQFWNLIINWLRLSFPSNFMNQLMNDRTFQSL